MSVDERSRSDQAEFNQRSDRKKSTNRQWRRSAMPAHSMMMLEAAANEPLNSSSSFDSPENLRQVPLQVARVPTSPQVFSPTGSECVLHPTLSQFTGVQSSPQALVPTGSECVPHPALSQFAGIQSSPLALVPATSECVSHPVSLFPTSLPAAGSGDDPNIALI